jgi:ferredoxin
MPIINYQTSGKQVEFDEGEDVNLLRVAIRNDCGVPYKCASGNCGTDRVFVVEGAEHLSPVRKKERERLGDEVNQGYRLACQTYTEGDVTLIWDPDSQPYMPEKSRKALKELWLSKGDTD